MAGSSTAYSYADFKYNEDVHTSVANAESKIRPLVDSNISGQYGSTLDQYADSTFIVGNKKAFQIIATDFTENVKSAEKKVNEYLAYAESQRAEIEKCMWTDLFAQQLADSAYTKFMADKSPYESTDLNGKYVYDSESHEADAEAERERVWMENRCYLW